MKELLRDVQRSVSTARSIPLSLSRTLLAINSQWRPTGLQEAVTSHQAESSGKQVPAAVGTHAIETAYQAAGLPDITAQIPEHAEHFLGSLFCCPLTKVILYLAACVMPTCTGLQQKS